MKKRLLNLMIALFASVTAFAQGYNVEVCVNLTGPQPNAPIVVTLSYYSNGVANTLTQTVANVVLPYTVCFPAYIQNPDSGFFAMAAGSISLSSCSPAQSYNYSQMISGNTTITVNAQNCNSGGSNTTCGVGAQAYADSLNANLVYFMSFPTGTAPYTYSWVFSDGSTSTLQNPSVTFANGGVNWGNVTVTDANGCVSSYSVSVQNTPPPPPACFSSISYQANYSSGNAGEVFFNGYIANSTPMLGTYSWDFGDGSTSTQANPQHTYTSSGYYYVCLTTNYNGCTYTSCTSIYVDLTWWNVGNPFQGPCTAGFMIMSSTANGAGLISIVNTSQGNNLSYTWNFGNGFISNNSTPFTTIVNSGIYPICLTISDSTGTCNSIFCDTITVDSLGNVTRAVLPGNIGIFVSGAPQPSTVTGIENMETNVKFGVSPNPSNGLVTLNTENFIGLTSISVIDLSGKEVYSKSIFAGKGLKNATLDLQHLANGNYMIKVISDSEIKTGKMIINH